MKLFFDTNILLHKNLEEFNFFYISNISIEELQKIKTSNLKDEQTKYKARNAVRWLKNNLNKFEIVLYQDKHLKVPFTVDSNDKRIIATALMQQKQRKEKILFQTMDLNCFFLAKSSGLNAELIEETQQSNYKGYAKIFCNSDDQLSDLYSKLYSKTFGQEEFLINEYILIYDKDNNLIDKYKYIGDNSFAKINFISAESRMFGKVKPIDPYQELVLDSFKHNQMTLVKGPAGTGKSLLSVAYLFSLLEKGEIDKIIIFCNTIATAGSAKLGYYPGSRSEKLLDSQIGNFLISKLGSRIAVEQLMQQEKLLLLPMSDIRGFDTSGMKAGIYITEAQNLTIELLKLALQRIGKDSICILDGDNKTQVDLALYAGNNNGLKRVSQVFKGQDFYGEITLQTIHRSKIAQVANNM